MKIKDQLNKLPKDIQDKAKKYITCDLNKTRPLKRWFDWSETTEGYNYWEVVSKTYKL